ncbi:type II secretion system F family protein [Arthrobacter sp.]|uniref:type II secretion system F family protein n=1 Tax=Arthrobacter sp. TaxID=1667 RepID=UPI00289C2FCB|nr:type II secretion system F family protein [Arthrobacter sp.]
MSVAWPEAFLAGTGLGIGLWLTVVRLPFLRRRTFADRIAPQLRATAHGSRLLTPADVTPFGPLERVFRPLLRDAVLSLNRINPAASALHRRLERSGKGRTVLEFRSEQLLYSGAGLLAGGVIGVWLVVNGRVAVPGVAVLALAGGVLGYLLRDYLLTREVNRREALMLAEFPSLAEMMALAVGAGESAGGALERITRTAHGELAGEFERVLAEARSGVPLLSALANLSKRTQLAPLSRFVDGITVAIERGTPLADVMRAQAQDVRDLAKRELMEEAGKKEIAMMVPLVFGVLPLTVLFAVFPGLSLLRLGL